MVLVNNSQIFNKSKSIRGDVMLRLDNRYLPETFKMFMWYLMSFQAGYINVGGFIIFGNFVSHVTGTSSQIGMGLATLDYEKIITFFTILTSFILGAGFASHNIGRRQDDGKEPMYIFVTGIKALVFFLVLLISEIYFDNQTMAVKLILIHLLSFACGIQNSTCSQATNGFLKPTHMTGLSTDIGINLFKLRGLSSDDQKVREEKNKNLIRIKILLSFIFGGVIAFIVFSVNGHHGFAFPFLISFLTFYTSIISEQTERVKGEKRRELLKRIKTAYKSIYGVFITTVIVGVIALLNQ